MADRRRATPAIVAGLLVGTAGVVWILLTHSNPPPALLYHVPLAAVFGAFGWSVTFDTTPAVRRVRIPATIIAAVLVLGRTLGGWPLSGHGVLGGLMATLAPRPWQRLLAGAVVVQSWITKFVVDTGPADVVIGALAGAALGALALGIERRTAAVPSSSGLE